MKKLFLALLLLFAFTATVSVSVADAAPTVQNGGDDCVIPDSGPWPPCATGGNTGGGGGDCVIPPSGPWPPCATGGNTGGGGGDCVIPPSGPWPPCATGGNTGGGGGDCVIPPSGPWPPCATGGNTGGGGGGDDCVIPPSGPWPPCATGGNTGGGGGGGGDCVIPPSGPWPPCATGGNTGGGGGGGGGGTTPPPSDEPTVEDFVARCGTLSYDLQVFDDDFVNAFAQDLGISYDEAYDFLVLFEVVEIPGAQGPTKPWDAQCFAFSALVMRSAAEQMGGLLDRLVNGSSESCGEWLDLYRFMELSPAYSGVPGEFISLYAPYLAARDTMEAAARDVSKFCLEGGTLSEFNFFRAREGIQQALAILGPVTESELLFEAYLGLHN